MLGLMQDWPLLISRIIDYAACQHGSREVVTRSVEGPIVRTDYDAIRTRSIERQGYRVIRFANTEVTQNLDGVLTQISFSLREKEGAAQPRKDEGVARMKKGGAA